MTLRFHCFRGCHHNIHISELRRAHPIWFARGNDRHWGELEYRILHSRQGAPYLAVRKWDDKFSDKRTQHWRINPIGANLAILPGVDHAFDSLQAVKAWLANPLSQALDG